MNEELEPLPAWKDRAIGEMLLNAGEWAWSAVRWWIAWNFAAYEAITNGVITPSQLTVVSCFFLMVASGYMAFTQLCNLIALAWEWLCDMFARHQ